MGLPLSGKSTVFNALTGGSARTGVFSGARDEVHVAVVEVPDERVETLCRILEPKKTTRARIEFVDVVGVERGAARKGDSSAEFLAPVRQTDAMLHVARAFPGESVPHPLGTVDATRDVGALEEEFIIADLLAVEKRLEKIGKLAAVGKKPEEKGEAEILEKCRKHLLEETPLREVEFSPEEERLLRGFQFLSMKPLLIVLNVGEDAAVADTAAETDAWSGPKRRAVSLCGKLEMEIAAASAADAAELMELAGLAEPASARVIKASYDLMGLVTFYTAVRSELTAWPIPIGTTAVRAAGEIHTDMERGFIRAEVVALDDLVECGSFAHAREKGLLRIEGKGYEVKDGDVLSIRFAP
ncbi:MAG: redox-regulated ATPase YchF [Candidatus Eiseniibacteriota bacterium]|nr:MAG: redox-regulated ATPase YchF [Candidatus Eisenbacteria bacterium]